MNRPKNTASTPYRVKTCSAHDTCASLSWRGNRLPRTVNSRAPKRRPAGETTASPRMGPTGREPPRVAEDGADGRGRGYPGGGDVQLLTGGQERRRHQHHLPR